MSFVIFLDYEDDNKLRESFIDPPGSGIESAVAAACRPVQPHIINILNIHTSIIQM